MRCLCPSSPRKLPPPEGGTTNGEGASLFVVPHLCGAFSAPCHARRSRLKGRLRDKKEQGMEKKSKRRFHCYCHRLIGSQKKAVPVERKGEFHDANLAPTPARRYSHNGNDLLQNGTPSEDYCAAGYANGFVSLAEIAVRTPGTLTPPHARRLVVKLLEAIFKIL